MNTSRRRGISWAKDVSGIPAVERHLGPDPVGYGCRYVFSGAEFVVNKGQLTDVAMPVISTWATPWHGLEAAFVFWNVCLGLAVFFLARIQALLYFINNIDDAEIVKRSRKHLVIETVLFLVFFLVFLVHLLLADGFAVDPETKEVYMQPYKYFMNLVEMPAVSAVLLAGVAGVLYGIARTILSGTWKRASGSAGQARYSRCWRCCFVPVGTIRLIILR